jgi:predicted nicotinamide N-methyase
MPQEKDTLIHKLQQSYNLTNIKLDLGGQHIVITSVANSYDLLDNISDEEFLKDEQMPYWAEVWPSSIVLSRFILESLNVEGASCIELGAGVGVVSVAAALGGAHVLCTDISDEALDFIRLNALGNKVDLDIARLDWRHITLPGKFDYVFAADVLYERRNHLPILHALDQLLKPGGKAIIGDPERQIASPFFDMLRENNFSCTSHKEHLNTTPRKLAIALHCIQKNSSA